MRAPEAWPNPPSQPTREKTRAAEGQVVRLVESGRINDQTSPIAVNAVLGCLDSNGRHLRAGDASCRGCDARCSAARGPRGVLIADRSVGSLGIRAAVATVAQESVTERLDVMRKWTIAEDEHAEPAAACDGPEQ